MPEKRKQGKQARKDRAATGTGRRPVWSGTLAFGLVTLPVELHPTIRSADASLRMISEDGMPLSRRYFSEKSGTLLEQDDIVRGYPLEDGSFVLIEDEELDELDPERSRVINLEMFVPVKQLDPLLVDNSYLLVPMQDALPAYRLLVASMADTGQAGIARFILRERAYQLALVSENGTLRALTLRYPDEIRSPDDLGLPEPEAADIDAIEELEAAMKRLQTDAFEQELLVDLEAQRLEELVNSKLRDDPEDVHEAEQDEEPSGQEGDDAADIMELLRKSLEADSSGRSSTAD